MKIVEVGHPLIQHKLGLMRRAGISTKELRELAAEVAALLTYAATRDLETVIRRIDGWAGPLDDQRLNENGYILPELGDAGDQVFGARQLPANN